MNLIKFLIYTIFIHIALSEIGLIQSSNTVNNLELKEILNKRELKEVVIDETVGFANFIFEKGENFSAIRKIRLPISVKENFLNKITDLIPKNKIDSINITYNTSQMSKYIWEIGLLIFVFTVIVKLLSSLVTINTESPFAQSYEQHGEFTVVEDHNTSFDDVIGLEPVKDDLKQIVDMIKNRENYLEYGCEIPRGLVFSGPPGCGKTLLAKAVAGQAGVSFISASGGDFMEMFVGVGASRVRKLFDLARKKSPCIIFIDEIDSIGKSRDKKFVSSGEQDTTLNALLHEMDGFKNNDNIMVIAATNLYNSLDKALVRSGRFDKKIVFDLPNKKEREELFDLYLKKIRLDEDIEKNKERYIKLLAGRTAGMSGADIQNITKQAILNFMKRNMTPIRKLAEDIVGGNVTSLLDRDGNALSTHNGLLNITGGANLKDLETGVDDIALGMVKRERSMNDKEKEVTAHHEAGHAVLSYVLKEIPSPVRVSIIPRGDASLGVTQYEPNDNKMETKEQLLARMSMAYGGRLAEEVEYNQITTGASSDISVITRIAYAMVTYYGMNENIGEIDTMSSENPYKDMISEGLKEKIDIEVKQLKDKVRKGSYMLMQKYKSKMEKIAQHLLENEEMNKEDFAKLFKEDPIENTESIKDYI